MQASITTTDYSFIQQVIDGSCQVLQGVSRLAQSNALSHCTVRILLRAIAASIFLLKALSMGAPTTRLDESLCTLQRGIEALRGSTWDDMHLASRYAALLELHVAHLRRSFVAGTAPDGIPIPDFNNSDATLGADGSIIGGYGSTGHFAGEEWLSLPFDVSMAPFGVTGNESAQFLGLDDGDWDFLWGLPLV